MLFSGFQSTTKNSCLMSQTCLKNGIGMVFTNGHAVW